MDDLLANAPRPYIRISEWASCDLRIGYAITATERRQRFFSDLSLRMGTALEPMVVEWLADNGLAVYFAGNDQLEVAVDDPYAVGHPDGMVYCPNAEDLSYWAHQNLPHEAKMLLLNKKPMMLEVKTMNEKQFNGFLKNGLQLGLISKYVGQIQGYLHVLANPEGDEAWVGHANNPAECVAYSPEDESEWHYGSESFRDALRQNGLERPTTCLVVVYCPGIREFAFAVIHEDKPAYEKRALELRLNVIQPLREGRYPEPTYDGSAEECFFCPYAWDCPAVAKLRADTILDDIPTSVFSGDKQVDLVAAEYHELNEQLKLLEDRKKELKEEIIRIAGEQEASFVTDNFFVTLKKTKGRRSLNKVAVAEKFGGVKNIPYHDGTPSMRLSVRSLFGPSAREDSNETEEDAD